MNNDVTFVIFRLLFPFIMIKIKNSVKIGFVVPSSRFGGIHLCKILPDAGLRICPPDRPILRLGVFPLIAIFQ